MCCGSGSVMCTLARSAPALSCWHRYKTALGQKKSCNVSCVTFSAHLILHLHAKHIPSAQKGIPEIRKFLGFLKIPFCSVSATTAVRQDDRATQGFEGANTGLMCILLTMTSVSATQFPETGNPVQVINATGPFSDSIRKMSDPDATKMIMASAGVHVTLPDYYSPEHLGMIVPKTQDGRVVFMLPWLDATIAGTTGGSSQPLRP